MLREHRRCSRGRVGSVLNRSASRNVCARVQPLAVSLELHADLVIEDPQLAVGALRDRLRHYRLHFLRHDADVARVAAVVDKAIEAEAVVEIAEERDVVLQRHVRTPATATAPPAAAAASAPSANTAAATAPAADTATAATAA